MAITFAQLQELIKKEGINYYIAPDRPVARFGIAGTYGRYEIVIHLQDGGQFLQFRTINYLFCPPGHAHLPALLQAVSILNTRKRLVKWGWDPADGEVVGYADLWIMDTQVSQPQFNRMMSNFIPGIDAGYQRLKATLDTGTDPGDQIPQAIAPAPTGGGGGPPMPPKLRELLDKLQKKDGDKPIDGKAADTAKAEPKPEIKEI